MADYFQLGTFDEKSWHGKENFYLDHNNIWQAMIDTGMNNVDFLKVHSYAKYQDRFIPITGKSQLVMIKDGEATPFGRQVSGYEPLQHRYMADLLQPAIDMSNGEIKLKGVALVGANWETSFVQLDLGEFQVAGFDEETHKSYLLLADNKVKGATHFLTTNVRVVCQNTYSFATEGMPSIPHGENGTMFLDFHAAMLERALNLKHEEQLLMERLFKTGITKDQVEQSLEVVFSKPKPTPAMRKASGITGNVEDNRILKVIEKAEEDTNRLASLIDLTKKRREIAMEQYEKYNDEFSHGAETAYAFFQGVTNTVSHSDTFTGDPWKNTISQLFLGGQKNSMLETAMSEAKKMARIS